MKIIARALVVLATILSPAVLAQDKPGVVAAEAAETVITVRAVDQAARTVTFETAEGVVETIRVPDQAQNLDQVHPGSKFKVLYLQSVVVGVVSGGGAPTAEEAEEVELAAKGATPGGVITKVKQVTANVEAIDYAARTVSVRGPMGKLRQFKVGPEVQRFDNVQVGDTVVLRYTEALGLKMIKQ